MFVKTLMVNLTCDLKNNSLVSELMGQYHKEGILTLRSENSLFVAATNKKLIDYIGCDIHEVTVHPCSDLRWNV